MDRQRTDQQVSDILCLAEENPDQISGPVQPAKESNPSSPSQQVRNGSTDTNPDDPHPVPYDQSEAQAPRDYHAHESCSDVSRSELSSPNHTQNTSANEAPYRTSSLASSANTVSNRTDASTAVPPINQVPSTPPGNPRLTSTTSQLQDTPRLQLSESLGLEGCAGIIGGFLGILGVFAFLNFLWFDYGSAPEAAEATWAWRQLAIRNWMPRAVTLASIILRVIVGIQATICTSMVTALLLERLSVPRLQVAHASVMRGINDGPWKLVMLVLSHKSNVLYLLRHPEAWLIILVALVSLALQFTSTILLSDMHSFEMVGDLNITTFNSLFAFPGEDRFQLFQGSLLPNAPVYPVFGEVSATHDSSPDNRGFSDTGLTQRGLLPMANSDIRTSVREYDGMGMIMSSRVACMRPIITNATLDLANGSDNFRRLQGVLHYSQSLQEARPGTGQLCSDPENCEQVAFGCTIPAAYDEEWATAGCSVDGVGGYFRGPYQPMWDPASGPWSENSSIWLVYSTNMTNEKWVSIPPSLSMDSAQPSSDSEWTVYEVVPGYFMKLAVCFSAFDFAYRDVHMRADGATTERSTTWSLVLGQNPDIEEVQTYLGLNPLHQSVADRGILNLEVMPDDGTAGVMPYVPPPPHYDLLDLPADQISPSALTASSLQLVMGYELCNGDTRNTTFLLCARCTIDAEPVHRDYAFLFSNIILEGTSGGGRAADALHGFISIAGFNVYDQFLAMSMDVAEQVRVMATRKVTVPESWPPSAAACAGLIAVASLLATYLALVTGTTVLYIRHTRYSRYGNVWHVVSQLAASEELEATLESGNNAGDKAIAEGLRMKESIKEDVLVKIGKTDGCESIKVRKCGP